MIDFTNCIEEFNCYGGKCLKKTFIYNGKQYLVKFPKPIVDNDTYSSNLFEFNTINEYIGCNIFKICGFEVQNTILGIYNYNGKEKIVCACEDFTDKYNRLCEFKTIALSINLDKRIGNEINNILEGLEEICSDYISIKNKFFDMFIIDSLIGNTNRHNGSWGFLVNRNTNKLVFSPIYNCDSCLNTLYDNEDLLDLESEEIEYMINNCCSRLKIDEESKRINYMSFIKGMENKDCNDALIRMMNKIDINKINEFIDSIDCISKVRKEFYKYIINERYQILKSTYNKLVNE